MTYDFDSADDGKATVRERDSMEQHRVPLEGIVSYIRDRVELAL